MEEVKRAWLTVDCAASDMRIVQHHYRTRREPLMTPFGFKGRFVRELWQPHVHLQDESGRSAVGMGVQSPLWCDAAMFARLGETESNDWMERLTRYALTAAAELEFKHPLDLMDQLVPIVYRHAADRLGHDRISRTFVLNAVTCIDHAAWSLYAQSCGEVSLFRLVPDPWKGGLPHRHSATASIPVIPYGMTGGEIAKLLEAGYFVLKIKLGSDPEGDGDPVKMLEWDQARLAQIHELANRYEAQGHADNSIVYYLDANGRYDRKERLLRLLEHAQSIGAWDRLVLFEEPLPETNQEDLRDIPVRFAADERVHSEQDALICLQQGYRAFALKPVAKTMSFSLQIARLAAEHQAPCFCADLTASPVLVDWTKLLSGHLAPLPGFRGGLTETNGAQNYKRWAEMRSEHPMRGASWTQARQGSFELSERFYACSGGALLHGDGSSVTDKSTYGKEGQP